MKDTWKETYKEEKNTKRHMDKDMYIYKYEESGFPLLWDILKWVISAMAGGNNQPPELSIVCFQEKKKELHIYLKIQGKTEWFAFIVIFRFIILHAFKTLHSRQIKTKTKTDNKEKKISQTNKESFIRKYAQHGKHMIQRAKRKEKKRNEQKLSGVYQCCSVSQTTSVKWLI